MKLSFTKMQGCANDYIYLDCRESGVPENIAALSEKLSRRHFSIGADGIICICAAQSAGADGCIPTASPKRPLPLIPSAV